MNDDSKERDMDLLVAISALDSISQTYAGRSPFVARFAAETIGRLRSRLSREFVGAMAKARDPG